MEEFREKILKESWEGFLEKPRVEFLEESWEEFWKALIDESREEFLEKPERIFCGTAEGMHWGIQNKFLEKFR